MTDKERLLKVLAHIGEAHIINMRTHGSPEITRHHGEAIKILEEMTQD